MRPCVFIGILTMTTQYNSFSTSTFYLITTLIANNGLAATNAKDSAITHVLGTTNESGIYSWNAIMDNQGQLWTGIYINRQRLIIKNPITTEIPLVTDRRLNPSGLALIPSDDKTLWIAYRNKAPERGIFVINSQTPTIHHKISGDSVPLARIALETDKQGGAYTLWYGEPAPTDQATTGYWLWFNHINKSGQFATPERVLPGIYPLWIHNKDGTIAVFGWYNDAVHGHHIGMRLRDSAGKFGPEILVAKIGYLSLPVGTFSTGSRWFIYWVAQYGKLKDEFLIEGAYSDNQGQTWNSFNLEALRKLDVRNIAVATDTKDHIALVISGRYRKPQAGQTNKFKSYLITSNDKGTNWNKPLILTPEYTAYSQAPNAKVAFVGASKQHLLLLVEDWRTIRSSIRYWLSKDNGTTWQVQDRAWNLNPKFNYQLSYNDESIYSHADTVTILMERLEDELATKTIISTTTSIQDLINVPEPIALTPDIERLKQRVNLYGNALITKNYQAAYDLFDPFYKARVDFIGHMQLQGRITYTKAEFANVTIQGNLATVQLHIVASVPPFKGRSGEIMQAPPRDMTIPVHWLWIDDEWYMEFYSEARELRYTRY